MRGSLPWVRRAVSAAMLLAVGFTPAEASVTPPQPCPRECTQAGTTRWVRPLTGPYVVQDDASGTIPAHGEAYAAIGADIAVLGLGTTVQAFDARTGAPRWTAQVGSPAGAGPSAGAAERIESVRTWPGVVSVGLVRVPSAPAGQQNAGTGRPAATGQPAGQAPAGQQAGQQAAGQQTDLLLDAATGHQIRAYPSAPLGGTVAADTRHAVVVQPTAVTSYRNSSGTEAWSVPTGTAPETWRLDGDELYMTVGTGGSLGGLAQQHPAELRRIDLNTGAERIIRARPGPFAGSLGAALGGVVLFGNADGVTAYSGSSGRRLWSRDRQDVPQGVDLVSHRFYLSEQGGLAAVNSWTGKLAGWLPGANGLYAERDGAALGMDGGPNGSAWGVDTTSQRVLWTVSNLPWPHYFVDLSGLGGSADPRSDALIVASCGQASPVATVQACAKPELVAINR
jgi:hypothetical protein